MTLEAPRPLLGAGVKMKKNHGIPKQFSGEKIVLYRKPDEVTRIDGIAR